jgi:6-phospho-beta-glucosidase
MKLAIIGGGSTYTPELFEGLIARAAEIGLTEVVLHDIDANRLDPVSGFCARMASAAGASFRVSNTLDLDSAITGATFVVTQIRVGGQAARLRDEQIPLEYGLIGQETTGAGGFAKALRTIPKILHIAGRVRELAPDAWVVNFTNPSGIITETLLRHGGVKAVGLCNIPMEMKIEAARAIGVDPSRVELDYIGLNHFGWIRGITLDGRDITPSIMAGFTGGAVPANIPELNFGPAFYRALGMIPSPYLQYFYATRDMLDRLRNERSRALVVMDLEDRLFTIYRDPAQHLKPELLSQRGGAWYSRVAIDVMAALLSDEPRRHVVNQVNRVDGSGAPIIPELPDDAVIEAPAMISRRGVCGIAADRVPEEIIGQIRHLKSYERLTIDAATLQSGRKALMALINNPLVADVHLAGRILERLVENGEITPAD